MKSADESADASPPQPTSGWCCFLSDLDPVTRMPALLGKRITSKTPALDDAVVEPNCCRLDMYWLSLNNSRAFGCNDAIERKLPSIRR